mgnify:CR=1 FL=1|jgi:Cytochrome b subunit of formate dehydrogenase
MAVEAHVTERSAESAARIQRHAGIDRLFHWVTAVAVLALLATGLLPVVGVEFSWVTIHWMTGLVLTLLVLFHLVRSLFWQRPKCMLIRPRDVSEALQAARAKPGEPVRLPGKYTLAQKLMHLALGLAVVVAVVTGVIMLAKIDTPFWKRDPYLLAAGTWGVVYLLHGLAALATLTLVMIHIYFGLLPEKRVYLRAMTRGWVTREELGASHDLERWPGRRAGRS